MCYSAESSMNGFLIGGAASLYLLFFSSNPTLKHMGLFFFAVVLMQLAEYFIWIDQDCNKNYNNLASKSIIPILALQVVAMLFGGYLFNTTILPKYFLKYLFIISSIVFLYYSINNFFINTNKFCTRPNKDSRLDWDKYNEITTPFMENIYKIIFTFIPFFLKEVRIGFLFFIVGINALISTRYENRGSWNSTWCFYSAYIPTIFVVISLIEQFSKKKFPFL